MGLKQMLSDGSRLRRYEKGGLLKQSMVAEEGGAARRAGSFEDDAELRSNFVYGLPGLSFELPPSSRFRRRICRYLL
jgi:hypothetical protein